MHVKGHGGYIGKDGVARLNVLDVQKQIRSIPKPVIAAVNGFAIGGGENFSINMKILGVFFITFCIWCCSKDTCMVLQKADQFMETYRAVIQRINGAEITINGGETRKVGEGLVVFICAMEGDTDAQADFLVQKVCGLRVFKDENDKMNRSLEDIKGDMLIVSNITLSADMKHGRRPDFSRSASPRGRSHRFGRFVPGL